MTTGRINQVTTFRPAFAAIDYSRATEPLAFVMWSSSSLLQYIKDPSQPKGAFLRMRVQASLNPQMASPHFPFSHVSGEIPWFREWEQGSPTFNEDYQRPVTPKKAHTDAADPRVVSCIRSDHRQAIHLLQHRSSMSHKDSLRLSKSKARATKAPPTNQPRPIPYWVRLPAWQDSLTRREITQPTIKEAY